MRKNLEILCELVGIEITAMDLFEVSFPPEVSHGLLQYQIAQAKLDSRKIIT